MSTQANDSLKADIIQLMSNIDKNILAAIFFLSSFVTKSFSTMSDFLWVEWVEDIVIYWLRARF